MVRSDIAQSAGDAVADSIGRLEDQVMEEIGLLRKEVTDLKFWVIGRPSAAALTNSNVSDDSRNAEEERNNNNEVMSQTRGPSSQQKATDQRLPAGKPQVEKALNHSQSHSAKPNDPQELIAAKEVTTAPERGGDELKMKTAAPVREKERDVTARSGTSLDGAQPRKQTIYDKNDVDDEYCFKCSSAKRKTSKTCELVPCQHCDLWFHRGDCFHGVHTTVAMPPYIAVSNDYDSFCPYCTEDHDTDALGSYRLQSGKEQSTWSAKRVRGPCVQCGEQFQNGKGLILDCFRCGRSYHMNCHQPEIADGDPTVALEKWTCGECLVEMTAANGSDGSGKRRSTGDKGSDSRTDRKQAELADNLPKKRATAQRVTKSSPKPAPITRRHSEKADKSPVTGENNIHHEEPLAPLGKSPTAGTKQTEPITIYSDPLEDEQEAESSESDDDDEDEIPAKTPDPKSQVWNGTLDRCGLYADRTKKPGYSVMEESGKHRDSIASIRSSTSVSSVKVTDFQQPGIAAPAPPSAMKRKSSTTATGTAKRRSGAEDRLSVSFVQ
ncbi:hypothetical protein LTS18_003096 [Coniosporium uncinatum]|uniref:Uncharacterized protein n=1 Tax=Coniosporium uncinatum TaxID=93489 RepID=A0ACC3D782_9PEZI|nr:hypothetical protein LTS18_003096 [Coniosporium uncinatum]